MGPGFRYGHDDRRSMSPLRYSVPGPAGVARRFARVFDVIWVLGRRLFPVQLARLFKGRYNLGFKRRIGFDLGTLAQNQICRGPPHFCE